MRLENYWSWTNAKIQYVVLLSIVELVPIACTINMFFFMITPLVLFAQEIFSKSKSGFSDQTQNPDTNFTKQICVFEFCDITCNLRIQLIPVATPHWGGARGNGCIRWL